MLFGRSFTWQWCCGDDANFWKQVSSCTFLKTILLSPLGKLQKWQFVKMSCTCIACSVYRNSSIFLWQVYKIKLFRLCAWVFLYFHIYNQSISFIFSIVFYLITPFLMLYGTVGHSLFINDHTYTVLYLFLMASKVGSFCCTL